jgi:hypothetical protein
VSFNGTSVGLDVHALSVVAHAVDEESGLVERARLCPDHGEVLRWLGQLRGPLRVAYEAGPTRPPPHRLAPIKRRPPRHKTGAAFTAY